MESEQFSFDVPPSPGHQRAYFLVQFSRGCLAPSPEARDAVFFGLENILYTAASDSEDFEAASLDVLPPSIQEARPSPAYTELVEVFARTTEKLSLDWSDEPRESQSSKLDEHFLSGSGLHPTRRKLAFFPDLHYEVFRSWKQPFSSHLTNAAAADFTNLVWFCGAGVRHSPDGRGHASCAPLAAFCPLLEERHLWLNLTEIRDKEKAYPLSLPALACSATLLWGYGGNLPLPKDNDRCFPLGVESGFRGTTGFRCLVR